MLEKLKEEFKGLIFDPDNHTYHFNGKELPATTRLVESFAPQFDRNIAKRIAKRDGITEEEVLAKWDKKRDDSQELGHNVHDFAEAYGRYILNGRNKPVSSMPQHIAVMDFFKELPRRYMPVAFEQSVFSHKYWYGGKFDLLLFDGKNGFVIVDYKTNEDIHKNYNGQMMHPPFQYLLDTPFNHYQLQLSLYQIPLTERKYFVVERWVVWLKRNGNYSILKCNDFTKMLKEHLS